MAESYEIIKGFQTKQGLGRYDYDYLHNKPDLATQEKAGLLSPEDKVRIDQIDEIKQSVDEIDYPVDSVNGKIGQVELTKDDIGLDKVENKSSEEIRNEITKENVTGALGYTPLTEDEINEAVLPISGGRMAGPIDMNNNSLTGLAQPQKDSDAATKTYVDKLVKNIDLSNYPTKEEVNNQFEEFQVAVDPTLSELGQAADAQAVGQAINQIEERISGFSGFVAQNEPPEDVDALWIDTDDESAEEAGSNIELDDSLTIEGMAADAKAVGDAIADMVYSGEAAGEAATVPLNADTLGGRPASEFATENFVITKIAEAQMEGGDVDLSGYATKDELNALTAEDVGARPDTWFPSISDIGAAPAGYGLGGDSQVVNTGWGSIAKNGYYYASPDNPIEGMNTDYWAGEHIEFGHANRAMQRIWYGSEIVQRIKWDGVWQPWEWVNPPMALGVEYRTTERWNGKPIYTMMANIGALPNNTSKTTEGGPLPMGITPISAYGVGLNGKTGAVIPSRHIYLSVYGEWGTVYVNTDSDYSNYTGYIIVKYVKD